MSTRSNRAFSEEFKAEAIRLVLEQSRSAQEVARSLGINTSTLLYWLKNHRKHNDAKASAVERDLREQLRDTQAKLQRAEMERDILKKAAALFAREQP